MRSSIAAAMVGAVALLVAPRVARDARAASDQPGATQKHGPGEPGTEAEPPGAPTDLPDRYEKTPGAHAERPGKHSTTTGRHGTSGQIGGGVNTQSGAGVAPSEDPVLEKRQRERDAQSND